MNNLDWSSIKIFVAAPRDMSVKRFTEIIKHYLPKGDIVFGIAKEKFVDGFEGQPQFEMLTQETIQPILDKLAANNSPNKLHILTYAQKDLPAIVTGLSEKQRVLLVNGSWKFAFHNSEAYKILSENKVPIKFISPFVDEDEAKTYQESHEPFIELPARGTLLSEGEMFAAAEKAALQSFDYSFQTGAALGKLHEDTYEILATSFNRVIPYQAYALHHGNSRERHLSKPHDTNHYDTIHAEMQFIVDAARGEYELEGATVFVNLLPCPNCARTLSQTNIDGIVYRTDHSDGYAVELLELCGKKVNRVP